MADRFDKFSERARTVMTLAQEEALALKHNYIGTEHLLLGLLREGEGLAAKVLANLGADLEKVRADITTIVGSGSAVILSEIGLTPRARKAIELAIKEAKRLNHGYIGTEHLLLGLLREGHGIAAGVLESLDIDLDRARAETMRLLNNGLPTGVRTRRYNLAVPDELFDDLQQLADDQHTSVVELLRRFIKLGLLATKVSETPGSALIIREGEKEREILLL